MALYTGAILWKGKKSLQEATRIQNKIEAVSRKSSSREIDRTITEAIAVSLIFPNSAYLGNVPFAFMNMIAAYHL